MKTSNSKTSLTFIMVILTFLFVGFSSIANATYTNLYEFTNGSSDGATPYNTLPTLYNNALYGTAKTGGSQSFGTIFRIDVDGSNYTNLHEFAGGIGDGKYPMASLILSGSTLYGTTGSGGSNDFGTVFKIDVDGSNYTNLHEFTGGTSDGKSPYGSLLLSGSTLYGMTVAGGNNDSGTVFKIDVDGSNYTNLHDFAGGAGDGKSPYSALILSDSTLYGATANGGSNDYGTVFKIDVDGSNYTDLHEFAGGTDDGKWPHCSLLLYNSILYGTTYGGGNDDYGTVFKINTNSSNFTIIYEFAGANGKNPRSTLIISDGALVGTTEAGGANNKGTIFKMGLNGEDYINIHSFAGGAGDGANPYRGALLECNNSLCGMTPAGGEDGKGVIFSQSIPEPAVLGFILMISGTLLKFRKN